MNITAKDFLDLIYKSESFATFCINTFTDIEADIRSYSRDINCSCRNKLTRYFETHQEKVIESILVWASRQSQSLNDILGKESIVHYKNILKTTLSSEEQNKYKDVIGEVVEIAPDPEEYKKIITIAREKWLYNGINILETVKRDNNGMESVVWLLLFY